MLFCSRLSKYTCTHAIHQELNTSCCPSPLYTIRWPCFAEFDRCRGLVSIFLLCTRITSSISQERFRSRNVGGGALALGLGAYIDRFFWPHRHFSTKNSCLQTSKLNTEYLGVSEETTEVVYLSKSMLLEVH